MNKEQHISVFGDHSNILILLTILQKDILKKLNHIISSEISWIDLEVN